MDRGNRWIFNWKVTQAQETHQKHASESAPRRKPEYGEATHHHLEYNVQANATLHERRYFLAPNSQQLVDAMYCVLLEAAQWFITYPGQDPFAVYDARLH